MRINGYGQLGLVSGGSYLLYLVSDRLSLQTAPLRSRFALLRWYILQGHPTLSACFLTNMAIAPSKFTHFAGYGTRAPLEMMTELGRS
jgi:hypothetical protein